MAENNNILKIGLNLPALERLFNGAPEIELNLRQQVVEQFTNKHLKAIFHDATWVKAAKMWQDALDVEVKRHLEISIKHLIGNEALSVADALRWRLSDLMRQQASATIDKIISEHVAREKAALLARVSATIEAAVKREVAAQVSAQTGEIVKAEVRRRMEAALELK